MTDGVRLVADASKSAHDNLSEAVDNMRATLRRIDDTVNNVAGWSGDAHGSFVGVGNVWGEQSIKLHAALDELTGNVGAGTAKYTAQEQDNQSLFKI